MRWIALLLLVSTAGCVTCEYTVSITHQVDPDTSVNVTFKPPTKIRWRE